MYAIENHKIGITEGDFGIELPITIELNNGETISQNDNFKFSIFEQINGDPILEKIYIVDETNTFNFSLTKEESRKLKVGHYFYDLDWYNGEVFLNNIVKRETFCVSEKAGRINEN